jgi:hypothetical protein
MGLVAIGKRSSAFRAFPKRCSTHRGESTTGCNSTGDVVMLG